VVNKAPVDVLPGFAVIVNGMFVYDRSLRAQAVQNNVTATNGHGRNKNYGLSCHMKNVDNGPSREEKQG